MPPAAPPTPPPLPCRHARHEEGCAFCVLVARDGRYARHFGRVSDTPPLLAATATGAAAVPLKDRVAGELRCVHLGAPTGWTVDCPTCPSAGSSRVQLKTFHCGKHQQCTIAAKPVPGVACCATCPDYRPPEGVLPPPPNPDLNFPVRDCLYHVYPLPAGRRAWRRGLGMLLARSSLFTGKKVISCMTAAHLEPAREVHRLAEPHGFEVVELTNNTGLRETKTLMELLGRFETTDRDRALFYGHTKGATRPDNAGVSCHPWAVLCHEICLDFWPLVEEQLKTWPITGPFKKVGKGFAGSASAWHYSGSFWWARSADLFARNWRAPDARWFGAESSPGVWYRPNEAGCLFHEGRQETLDLYRMDLMKEVLCEYALWRAEREAARGVLTT